MFRESDNPQSGIKGQEKVISDRTGADPEPFADKQALAPKPNV